MKIFTAPVHKELVRQGIGKKVVTMDIGRPQLQLVTQSVRRKLSTALEHTNVSLVVTNK